MLGGESPRERFESAERETLGPLAQRPYRANQAEVPKASPGAERTVEVERRALEESAEMTR